MKVKCLSITVVIGIFILPSTAIAMSSYGEINTYYNNELLPGKEVAKPMLKIGEPFKIKIEMTLNQTSSLFVQVCSLGGNLFKVVDGPSEFEKTKYIKSLDPVKYIFEGTIVPTDEWAGGSIPINFWYQINLPGEDDPAVTGEFTVAYCTISNEHYEGETPTSKEQPVSGSQPTPKSAPAFSLVTAIAALALVFLEFIHK
ncbi:sarcinarray family protein [Methanosarcina sp. Ant1]|nr:sarcinarray family protein [Methanosarcina sp. Ant1]